MQQWLRRPALSITLSPGRARRDYDGIEGGRRRRDRRKPRTTERPKPTRRIPPVGPLQPLTWPAISHTRLSNGIELDYAQRTAVPLTQVALAFDAGGGRPIRSAQRGLAAMTMGLLEQGTTSLSAQQIAEAEERLGAEISTGNDADRSIVTLSALSPNLAPSLDLLADIVEHPAFAPAEIDRVRAQSLTGIAQMMKDPQRVGARVLPAAIFGAAHPYGARAGRRPGGDRQVQPRRSDRFPAALAAARQRQDLRRFRPPAERGPGRSSRREFGTWAAPAVAKGVKSFPGPARASGEPEDPAGRPARRAAVDDPRRPAAADRPVSATSRRSTSPTRRSAGNSCRGSTWTCARPRAGPTASAGSQTILPQRRLLHDLGAGPGGPHRGRAGRAERRRRRVPGTPRA